MVGCGGDSSHKAGNASADYLSAQAVDANSVAELVKFGASIKPDDQGEVIEVDRTDTQITAAGLVHLEGLTNLRELKLWRTQITDAGVAELKKALPN